MADCRKCKHNYKPPTCEPKCNRMCDGESDFEPITNADRIRSMSDEELAEYLSSLIRNGHEYLTGEGDWRQWLQSEAEQQKELEGK